MAIVLVVLLAGGLLAYNAYQSNRITQPTIQTNQNSPAANETDSTDTTSAASDSAGTDSGSKVTITSSGFTPETITINVGDTVTWVNNDTTNHTVNSDNHPNHLLYPILNEAGLIKPSESSSVTFNEAGTFTYHDHLNAALVGKVVVK